MRVLSRNTLSEFWKAHADSETALMIWYNEAAKAIWTTPQDIKRNHKTASFLGDNRVVFNICGNKYRLVVRVYYPKKIVYVRFIGTHAEYDKIKAEDI